MKTSKNSFYIHRPAEFVSESPQKQNTGASPRANEIPPLPLHRRHWLLNTCGFRIIYYICIFLIKYSTFFVWNVHIVAVANI